MPAKLLGVVAWSVITPEAMFTAYLALWVRSLVGLMVTWCWFEPVPKVTWELPMGMVRLSVLSPVFLMTMLPVPACTASLKLMTKFVSLATLVALSAGLRPLVVSTVGAVVSATAVKVSLAISSVESQSPSPSPSPSKYAL